MQAIESPIYISGPMTGLPDNNRAAFDLAATVLRQLGHEVSNPAEIAEQPSWAEYMRQDIKSMMDCRTVVVLDGAYASRGAMIELSLAQALGMPVVPFGKVPLVSVRVA